MSEFTLDDGRPFRHPDAEQFIADMEAAGFKPLFDGNRRRFGYDGPYVRVLQTERERVQAATKIKLTHGLSGGTRHGGQHIVMHPY